MGDKITLTIQERELHGKGRKKCCQTQAHALLEGDLPLAVLQSLPPPFVW